MNDTSIASSVYRDAVEEFDLAWKNPRFTQIELPAVSVNEVLRAKYVASPEVTLTRTMIWDMEMKKAWDPLTYIPYVVSEGRSWGRRLLDRRAERFYRSSIQNSWLDVGRGRVLEDVFIDHVERKVLFLGRNQLPSDDDTVVEADDFQPLFHVEHAAGGGEADPVNLWRIVVLTDQRDDRYLRPFDEMVRKGLLPGFIEIYIERDLHVNLKRVA